MAGENRLAKEQVVAEIKSKLEKAKCIVLVDYLGINVEQDTKLRAELRKNNVEYKVYKNRLVQRVMTELGYESINNELQGTVALAISYDDIVAPSKVITANSKAFNKLKIKAGVVEGTVSDAATMEKLATIPSKEVLIGQILGMLTMPMRGLAVAISEIAKKKAA